MPEYSQDPRSPRKSRRRNSHRACGDLSGKLPCPFLLWLPNYRDRYMNLAASRTKPDLRYQNAKIQIFLYYSPGVQQRRHIFTEVYKQLRDTGIKYSLLFLSKLWVVDGATVHFFETADAAVPNSTLLQSAFLVPSYAQVLEFFLLLKLCRTIFIKPALMPIFLQ